MPDVNDSKKVLDGAEPDVRIRWKTPLLGSRALFKLPRLLNPELTMRIAKYEAEKNAAPLITRDAILALLAESRSQSRRERLIVALSVGSFLLALAALLAAVL